jgi:hypothetical protein
MMWPQFRSAGFAGSGIPKQRAVAKIPISIVRIRWNTQAVNMSVGERKERWVAMMKILERNDITAWRERFVRALSAIDTRR